MNWLDACLGGWAKARTLWGCVMRSVWSGGLASAVVLFAVSTVPALAADAAGTYGFGGPWQGVYLGLNGGGGWETAANTYGKDGSAAPGIKGNGWVAGGQVGYNWEYANFAVIGLEARADYAAIKGNVADSFDPGGGMGTQHVTDTATINELGDFRAKVGFAIGPVMPYFAGGVAIGRASFDVTGDMTGNASKTFTGWTAGGGAEFALTPHWSLLADFSYYDLGTQNFMVPGPGGGTNVHLTASTVTGGLNLRW